MGYTVALADIGKFRGQDTKVIEPYCLFSHRPHKEIL